MLQHTPDVTGKRPSRNVEATSQTERFAARLMWLAILFYAGFLGMAYVVNEGWTAGFDEWMIRSMRSAQNAADPWGPAWFEEMGAEFTALGGYTILVSLFTLVAGALLLLRQYAAAIFATVAVLTGSAAAHGLKLLFDRPRPDVVDHLDATFTSSFPSAHSAVSMVAYLTLAALIVRLVPKRSFRTYVVICAILLSALIGLSRVYLGVHWPSDVVAGWLFGGGWAMTCWLIAHRLSAARRPQADLGTSCAERE